MCQICLLNQSVVSGNRRRWTEEELDVLQKTFAGLLLFPTSGMCSSSVYHWKHALLHKSKLVHGHLFSVV